MYEIHDVLGVLTCAVSVWAFNPLGPGGTFMVENMAVTSPIAIF